MSADICETSELAKGRNLTETFKIYLILQNFQKPRDLCLSRVRKFYGHIFLTVFDDFRCHSKAEYKTVKCLIFKYASKISWNLQIFLQKDIPAKLPNSQKA